MRFKFEYRYRDRPDETQWEEYDEITDDAEKWAKDTLEFFNNTLRPGESARDFIQCVVLDADSQEKHSWDKDITRMSAQFRGAIIDGMYCKKCGITGKRFGLNPNVKIDSKYRAKKFHRCDTAFAFLKGEAE